VFQPALALTSIAINPDGIYDSRVILKISNGHACTFIKLMVLVKGSLDFSDAGAINLKAA
jgi:hypothetical protein